MNAYNFSKLQKREAKLYSFGDLKISSSGLALHFLIMAVVFVVVSFVLHFIVSSALGVAYWIPMDGSGDINLWGIMLVYGLPIGLAAMLYYCKVQQYRLYEFLFLYFKPKHDIAISGRRIIHEKYSYKAFLEKQTSEG